jgi:hypothetical protein
MGSYQVQSPCCDEFVCEAPSAREAAKAWARWYAGGVAVTFERVLLVRNLRNGKVTTLRAGNTSGSVRVWK